MSIIPEILLLWYITIFISTEFFSYFNLINRSLIIAVNIIFLAFVFVVYRERLKTLIKKIRFDIFFYVISGLLGLTFIQGLLSAPNTTDSMVYHLPRVMYWVQEHTLYQDTIRNGHDFMAPFAEYLLLHLYLSFNGDRILFFSQWSAFVASMVLSFLVAKQLGAEEKRAKFIALFVASLPIALLQATSTQTDMITTVMVLFSIYFALLLKKSPTLQNSLLFGFAIGLGILTKATFILYVLIPLALLLKTFLKDWKRYLRLGLISIFIISMIQIRFINQNLQLYGNISGERVLEGESGYINEVITPEVIASNLIRNVFSHTPVPYGVSAVQDSIVYIHKLMGIELNDAKTTYYDTKFKVLTIIFPQEDIVGNPIHLVIIFSAGIFLILRYRRVNSPYVYLFFLTVISFIIFSAVLKWQPFHSRLQIPFFVVGTISGLCILFNNKRFIIVLNFLLGLSVFFSFVLIILNVSKPFISYSSFYPYIKHFAPPLSDIPQSFFTRDRDRQYFTARYYWYHPYEEIIKVLSEKQIKTNTIAFNLMDGFEYPLWMFAKRYKLNYRIVPNLKASKDTIIITTSVLPYKKSGYLTECVRTEIEYGYACIAVIEK